MGRRAMCRWRAYVLYMRGLLRRCFDGWNIDACHRRLQRMNAFRMLQLLCPLGKRLALRWLAQQWRRLQAACARVLIRRHVKLLFTCWKTVTSAMREGRRRVQGRAVQRLKQHVVEEGERERAMGRAFETILTRLRQQRAWKQWANRRRRSGVLRGVLLRLSRDLLRLALRHWRRPPCRARPARLAPAVPDGYVRRGSRLPPVPPHQVVALGALQSVRLAEQQLGARIEFRLRRVGGMQGHYERQQELRQEREEQLRGQQQRAAAAGEVLRGSHGHGYWQGQGPGAGQVGQSLNINTSHTHSSKYSPRHSRSDSPSYQATGAAGAGGKAAETGRGAAMTAAGTAGTAGTETVAGMGVVSRRGRYEEADLSTSDISSRGMGARAAGGAREDMGMGLGMMGMNPLASPPPNASLDASSIAFSVALSSEWPISAHIACTDSYADDFEEEAGSGSGAEAEA
ncbi:hypothetical protein B484DRAFT_449378 [Ochromonadaceae sp. CCMP2298]|nr:hypothetical protein B484DRAFT_449378 [Ochromonadaceae sp. CCMP2298]